MLHQPDCVFTVYILQSIESGRFYVGQTVDLDGRLDEHNQGRSKSTRAHRPWRIVHTEQFRTRSAAIRRESQIKSWKSAKAIQDLAGL